jgi:peptidoglycan hydrolase-like protein with peptidoglycan-binding domain
MQGDDVALLQRELALLSYTLAPAELQGQIFRNTTQEAVRDFQRKRGLEATGVVDERTAALINAAVDGRPARGYAVRGQVRHQDGAPLPGMAVRAFDKELRGERSLGEEATSDESGSYQIAYTTEQLDEGRRPQINLVVRVFSPEDRLLAESETLFNAPAMAQVDLVVAPRPPAALSEYEQLMADLAPLLQEA